MTTELNVWALLAEGDDALTEAAFRTGDFDRARELLESARAEAAPSADVAAHARSLDLLGLLLHYENIAKLMGGSAVSADAIDAEEQMFRQALACWNKLGEPVGAAQSLFGLGLVYQVLHSDWMTAMPYYWQALGLVSDPDADADLYLRSEVHRHVGFYFLVEAMQPGEAERHLQISLDLRQELGDPRRIPSGLLALGRAVLESGGRDRAIELLQRAVAEARAAELLPERIRDAENALAEAEAEPGAETAGESEPGAETAGESEPGAETAGESGPGSETAGESRPSAQTVSAGEADTGPSADADGSAGADETDASANGADPAAAATGQADDGAGQATGSD
jgi:tetratricopeptide (TPR) repeat protein